MTIANLIKVPFSQYFNFSVGVHACLFFNCCQNHEEGCTLRRTCDFQVVLLNTGVSIVYFFLSFFTGLAHT